MCIIPSTVPKAGELRTPVVKSPRKGAYVIRRRIPPVVAQGPTMDHSVSTIARELKAGGFEIDMNLAL